MSAVASEGSHYLRCVFAETLFEVVGEVFEHYFVDDFGYGVVDEVDLHSESGNEVVHHIDLNGGFDYFAEVEFRQAEILDSEHSHKKI